MLEKRLLTIRVSGVSCTEAQRALVDKLKGLLDAPCLHLEVRASSQAVSFGFSGTMFGKGGRSDVNRTSRAEASFLTICLGPVDDVAALVERMDFGSVSRVGEREIALHIEASGSP